MILYDTGDFVDDYAIDARLRNDRRFLFDVMVSATGEISEHRLHPTEILDYSDHQAGPAVGKVEPGSDARSLRTF